jgi:hypothetical protein
MIEREQGLLAIRRARVKQRCLDIDLGAEQCPDSEGVKTTLKLASAFDDDLSHVVVQAARLVVNNPCATAVAREIEPVEKAFRRHHRLGVIALLERRPMSVPLIKLIVLASFCRMSNYK